MTLGDEPTRWSSRSRRRPRPARSTLRETFGGRRPHPAQHARSTARWRITRRREGDVPVAGPEVSLVYDDDRFDWQTTRAATSSASTGTRATRPSASAPCDIGEEAVAETAALLGVTEDEPVDFFIYADQDVVLRRARPGHPRERRWPGQRRHPDPVRAHRARPRSTTRGSASSSPTSSSTSSSTRPSRTRTTSRRAGSTRAWRRTSARATTPSDRGDRRGRRGRDGPIIPLDGLGGQFPTTADGFFLAYAESVSAVDFLIRTHGQDALARAHRLVRRRPHRRRGVQAGHRPGRRRLRRRLAGRSRRRGAGPPGSAARPGRPAAGRLGRAGAASPRARRDERARADGHAGARHATGPEPSTSAARPLPVLVIGGLLVLAGVGLVVARRRRRTAPRRDRAGPAAGHPDLAIDPRPGPARPRLPRRRPARVGGPAGPLHDPGAVAARRDRQRAAGAAGPAQAGHPRPARRRSRTTEGAGEGSAAVVRELNDELEQARIAAGLIPLTGTGIVLQLEDSLDPVAPGCQRARLPGRRARPAHGRRRAVGGRGRGHRGQRRAHRAHDRDHRRRPVDPGQLGVPRAAVPGHRPRAARPVQPACRPRPASSTSSGPAPRATASASSSPSPRRVDVPAFAGTVTLRYARPQAADAAPSGRRRRPGRLTMHRRRNQLTIAAVAFVLGLLVVVQLRTQASGAAFAGLSSQDLTVLVANLNARNDQLRREASPTSQRELATLTANARPRRRLDRRAARRPAAGPAVRRPGSGDRSRASSSSSAARSTGPAVEDLLNELRNAGAEAIAIDGVRVVPGPGRRPARPAR